MNEIIQLLKAFSLLSGGQLVIKERGDSLQGLLPPEHYMHCNDYCLRVKESRRNFRKCVREDCGDLHFAASKKSSPFRRQCHAGVVELAVPIEVVGEPIGIILFGPFRDRGAECPLPNCRQEFLKLAISNPEILNAAELVLAELAEKIATRLQEQLQPPAPTSHGKNKKIALALSYIRKNLHQSPSASEIADKCGLSTSRFLHLFKEETKESFMTIVQRERLLKAKSLLQETSLTIKEISEICGFRSNSYFCLAFRKRTGLTPVAYRKQTARSLEP